MNHAVIEGYTNVVGEKQGYKPLHIRQTPIVDPVSKANTFLQETAWTPTPDEVAKIVAGASVHVKLLTKGHPPIKVDVGAVPSQE